MAVWSQATLSGITVFDRCDGEYFLPAYINNEKELAQVETTPLPQMFHVSDGNHLSISKHFSHDGDIPYFRGQDINDFFIENASPTMIPEKVFSSPMMVRSHFFAGDVLLSIVGTIGSLSIVPESLGSATGSCKIAILRSRGVYSPFVLAAFLLSRFGQLQIRRNTRGAVQMGLILKDLVRVHVPIFEETIANQIEHFVKQAIEANTQSKSAYTQAQQLLEFELGLDRLCFDKPVGYTARLSELELSRRVDAEFFNPELRYFQQELAKHQPLRPITDFVSILKFSNPPYSDVGLPIITQKHLGKISPDNYGDDLVAHDAWVRANSLATIKNYDLLYYSVGAYLGKTNIWLSDDKAVHASFITMLRPFDPEESGFLHVLLNSKYGLLQSKCFQSGTSQPYIYPKDIRRFLVPFASKSLKRQLHELVVESYNKGEESKLLLDQAKSRVEQLIEEAVRA